jgi:hypothetical protein
MYCVLFMLNEYSAIHRMPLHIRLSTTCIYFMKKSVNWLRIQVIHVLPLDVSKWPSCVNARSASSYMLGPGTRASTADIRAMISASNQAIPQLLSTHPWPDQGMRYIDEFAFNSFLEMTSLQTNVYKFAELSGMTYIIGCFVVLSFRTSSSASGKVGCGCASLSEFYFRISPLAKAGTKPRHASQHPTTNNSPTPYQTT